ncbi:hypothetical protein MXL91_25070 [Achromobacter ruhlandii]|uniref:hypothetical protein n=1 Tax=Achromobacter ruhlandii TaxID=72557 RepID=UPI002DBE1195|nr:hypothetical protein [Achromobacter ruhlandii]MEB6664750.1 hypothetical protein [Achromobacter ruhlandii]
MSNISPKYAAIIQSDFYRLTLDDYSPCGLVGTSPGAWSYAVDVIYRCLKVGYWNLWNEGWMKARQLRNYEDFCNKLAQFNPHKLSNEGAIYWLSPLIYSSDLGEQLVKKYDLATLESYEAGKEYSVCKPFIDEIEKTFTENNIPWGKKLFPVQA